MGIQRKIEFKAKTMFSDRWVYGDFSHGNMGEGIITNPHTKESWIVQLGTVSQYTGLKDKNNKKIFEGDIVKIQKGISEKCIISTHINEVKYRVHNYFSGFEPFDNSDIVFCEIIGNSFDKKENKK